jgi:hypothetical protein
LHYDNVLMLYCGKLYNMSQIKITWLTKGAFTLGVRDSSVESINTILAI